VRAISIATSLLAGLAVVLTATLAPGEALASQDRHKWWASERSKNEIGLSPQQSQELEAIFQSVLPQLRAAKTELDRLEQRVSQLLAEGTADEATFAQALERVEAARGTLNKTRTLMLFRMYKILSPDQRVKLRAIHERVETERRQRHGASPSPD
jgi:Spy/CpxP family protein refolding chaperone